ncbi:MAG: VCBS repeat-containing protein [Planctomycetes bacterium]|nr:VCBS repeat-containing protein [Planctomycetota bacterium]
MIRSISLAALALTVPFTALGSAQVSFSPATSYALVGLRPDGVASADFDGANGADFAVATGTLSGANGPEWVEVFVNQGGGAFAHGQSVLLGNNVGAAALVAGDFDLDGDMDLAVTQKNTNTVRILVNNVGVFTLGASVSVGGATPANMASADVDGDGDLDLVTSNRDSNSLSVLINDGAGVFVLSTTLAVGADPRHLALDDFNGDCRTDIAVAASDSRRVDVLFNLGAGTFGAAQGFLMPGNDKPDGLVAADLDADGDVDLATTTDNNNLGLVIVLRNTGGTFTSATFLSNGSNPSAIIAGDFDGDGDKDLVAADGDANRVSALPNLGAAVFGAATIFPVSSFPGSFATADFDGNGSLDLVTSNRDSNNVSVLLNATAGGTSNFCVTSPNSAGFGTRIDSMGALSLAASNFTLLVRCAPANAPGLFFYGSAATSAVFGNGRLCATGALARLAVITVDATGHAAQPVPLNAFSAGSTAYFQFWHRDVAGGGSLFDLSDGLRATFRP